MGVAVWAYLDPRFDQEIADSEVLVARVATINATVQITSGIGRGERWLFLLLILLVVASSLLLLGTGLLWGSKHYRSLKSLLMFVTLASLWVGLVVSLPNIAWYGKQVRVAKLLDDFEPIATELQADWPADDGESPTLGPYMAYPIGQPVTLVLLKPPVLQPSGTTITLVERSKRGGFRFHLAGSELGDWLEFHPPGQQPESFQGGLQQHFELVRQRQLCSSWFLTRYQLLSLP